MVGELGQQQRELLQVDAAAVHDALLGAAAVPRAAGGRGRGSAPPLGGALGEIGGGGGGAAQSQEPQRQQRPAAGRHRPWKPKELGVSTTRPSPGGPIPSETPRGSPAAAPLPAHVIYCVFLY